jgi:hypothetical protein
MEEGRDTTGDDFAAAVQARRRERVLYNLR